MTTYVSLLMIIMSKREFLDTPYKTYLFLIKQEARFGFYRDKYLVFYIGYLKLSLRGTVLAIASSVYAAVSAPLRTIGNCGTSSRTAWARIKRISQGVHAIVAYLS